jgi:hypothetical protein
MTPRIPQASPPRQIETVGWDQRRGSGLRGAVGSHFRGWRDSQGGDSGSRSSLLSE